MVLSIPDESCPESSFRALQGLACLVIALRLGWNRNRLLPSPYRSHSSLHRDRHLFPKLVTAAPTLTPIIYTRVEYLEIIPKLKKKEINTRWSIIVSTGRVFGAANDAKDEMCRCEPAASSQEVPQTCSIRGSSEWKTVGQVPTWLEFS